MVDENPLEDVRHARAVRAVALNGRWVAEAELETDRALSVIELLLTTQAGDQEIVGAIELYRKALEVDPGFANAARQLERLLAEGVE